MNEDKVREAIGIGKSYDRPHTINEYEVVRKMVKTLEQAIAPEQPEIPEGCPVLCWYDDHEVAPVKTFCVEKREGSVYLTEKGCYNRVEIDYQRKGHVIPFECHKFDGESPVDDETSFITVFIKSHLHIQGRFEEVMRAGDCIWDERVLAYVIWPEWVK